MADRSRATVDAEVASGTEPTPDPADDAQTAPGRQIDAPADTARPEEGKAADTGHSAEHSAENAPENTPETEEAEEAEAGEAEPAAGEEEREPVVALAPTRHSGDRIADRYRLEECITQAGVFTSWRAVDEKLHRAVGIHLLAAGHRRSRRALAAARSAALLGDPRFVQVLDAVEDGELVYIVREWLPDATDLGTLLAREALPPHEAHQMVRHVTAAIAAAHRRGQSHLRLTPACVLRTDSGQYRINGIAVDAALHGLEAADRSEAERVDTRAIGALLYASLICRWPQPEDRYGLKGIPKELGEVRPDQVRAGVHRGLSELAAQTLFDDPGRHLEPITTPEALAKAVALLPKVRLPEPPPVLPPSYPSPGFSGNGRLQPSNPGRTPPPAPAPAAPPTLPGRTGKLIKWVVGAVVVAAVGLGSWGLSEAVLHPDRASGANVRADTGSTGGSSGGGQSKSGTSTGSPLTITGATEFSPLGPAIAPGKAQLAIDGSTSTSWTTNHFLNYPNFGNLSDRADGSGIVVDLGSVKSVSGVKIWLPFTGQTMDVCAASADATSEPTQLSGFSQTIAGSQLTGTTLQKTLSKPVSTRYILVHISSLGAEQTAANSYHGGISEIQILG